MFKNFAKFTVDGTVGYNAAQSIIGISGSESGRMPSPPFIASWWNSTDYGDPADDPSAETIKATGLTSGNIITVIRGYDGTTASTKNTASKVYKMVAGVSREHASQAFGNNFGYNLDMGLRKYRVLLGSSGVDIVCVGESILEGYNAPDRVNQSWVGLVRKKLQSLYGDGGIGFCPLYRGSGDASGPGWTANGSWVGRSNNGPFTCARACNEGPTSFQIIKFTGTNFYLNHVNSSSFGTNTPGIRPSYSIDGATAVEFNTLGAFNYPDASLGISMGSYGEHTLRLNGAGGGKDLELWGGSVMNGSGNGFFTGIRVHNVGRNGTKIEETSADKNAAFLAQYRPALTIIGFSSNNYFPGQSNLDTFQSNMTNLARTGLLYGSVLFVGLNARNEYGAIPQKSYHDRIRNICDIYNCSMVDLLDRWGTGNSPVSLGASDDGIHPNVIGHHDISRFVLKAILEVQ